MIQLHSRYLNIGTCMDYNDNLTDTILSAIDLGMYTFVISLGNSRNCSRKRVQTDDIDTCTALTSRFPIILFSLVPSMYNFCGSLRFLAWNGNSEQDTKTIHQIQEIEYELNTMSKLGGSVIMELGSHKGHRVNAIESILKSINRIRFRLGNRLVLINSVHRFHNIGTDLFTLSEVFHKVNKRVKQYLSIGIHTSYLFVNGIYDWRDIQQVRVFFDDFDKLFPEKHTFSVVFISDCANEFGSNEYTYRPIGQGTIWSDDSLHEFLHECQRRTICVLTETQDDMHVLRMLI